MTAPAKPQREDQEAWKKWQTCTRKIAYAERPKTGPKMLAYICPYCGRWHKTKNKWWNKYPTPPDRPKRKIVVRGGFEMEK